MSDATPGRRRRRGAQWVSKTDIVRYDRCPYGFWLADTGQVSLEEIYGARTRQLLRAGIDFETAVIDEAIPAPDKPLDELFVERHQLVNVVSADGKVTHPAD